MDNVHLRRPFDPVAHDLDPTFRLTRNSDLKGCGCKVPQTVLHRLMTDIYTPPVNEDEQQFNQMFMESHETAQVQRIGSAGMTDCSMIKLKHGDLCMLHASDYLYPLIEDPYMMGMIACACVLSDLYATGVTDCDHIQMLLGISSKVTQKERDVVAPLMIRGFKDAAETAGCGVKGGQTVVNPWMILGGIATAVVPRNHIVMPHNAQVSDVLVLTKPLGTLIATTSYHWMNDDRERWSRIKVVLNTEEANKSFQRALSTMVRLNKTAADVMRQYNAHGATDVSGYGLVGAAQALAKSQTNEVDFVIHNLPVIAKMASVNKVMGNVFNLTQGQSAETSGGLLIVFPREDGAAYAKKMEQLEGLQSWIVGVVQKGTRSARVIDKPRIIEVPMKDKPDELW